MGSMLGEAIRELLAFENAHRNSVVDSTKSIWQSKNVPAQDRKYSDSGKQVFQSSNIQDFQPDYWRISVCFDFAQCESASVACL